MPSLPRRAPRHACSVSSCGCAREPASGSDADGDTDGTPTPQGTRGDGLQSSLTPRQTAAARYLIGRSLCHFYWRLTRLRTRIESRLSEHHDRNAARCFLTRLIDVSGRTPARVTIDGHPAYAHAIRCIAAQKIPASLRPAVCAYRRSVRPYDSPCAGPKVSDLANSVFLVLLS